jgi:hypothetical protein
MDAAITTLIVGVGTVGMMGLLAAGTQSNQDTAKLTTAVQLANNIHELCDRLSFADTSNVWGPQSGQAAPGMVNVTEVGGALASGVATSATYSAASGTGPLDATQNVIPSMTDWAQTVTVHSVSPTQSIASNTSADSTATYPMVRVTVSVTYNGNQVYKTSWIEAQ